MFGNQSLVERIFEVQAKPLQQEPEQFRKNFGAGMPFMLGFLGDQQLQARFSDAFKTFFEDPQSIRFTVKPAAPLPLGAFESLDRADPGEVIRLLNVQVEANR